MRAGFAFASVFLALAFAGAVFVLCFTDAVVLFCASFAAFFRAVLAAARFDAVIVLSTLLLSSAGFGLTLSALSGYARRLSMALSICSFMMIASADASSFVWDDICDASLIVGRVSGFCSSV